MKNARPRSRLELWGSTRASSSSVTTTPGIRPAQNARAAASSSLRAFQPIWLITKRAPARTFLASFRYWGTTSRSNRL
jgi:hypothetical protein